MIKSISNLIISRYNHLPIIAHALHALLLSIFFKLHSKILNNNQAAPRIQEKLFECSLMLGAHLVMVRHSRALLFIAIVLERLA